MKNLCVTLWGTKIGYLHYEPYYPYITFEYDSSFQKSNIELSPLLLPLNDTVYNFPFLTDEPFYNLPGFIAFSLPSIFGSSILKASLSLNKEKRGELNPIERLALIGKNGMGALEYLSLNENIEIDTEVDITLIAQLCYEVMNSKDNFILLPSKKELFDILKQNALIAKGDSVKLLASFDEESNTVYSSLNKIKKGRIPVLIKMDLSCKGLKDSKQKTRIEYVYYKMAIDCGINIMPSFLLEKDGYSHFVTQRFDRTTDNKKLYVQSLSSLIQKSPKDKYACSYEKASDYMKNLGVYEKDIEQFYRLMVFNILTVNQKDDISNISFIMDKEGNYRLAPCYDLSFCEDRIDGHKMSINNKSDNINNIDLIFCGKRMGLRDKKCSKILKEVGEVVKNFSYYAHEYHVSEYNIDHIQKCMNEHNSSIWY